MNKEKERERLHDLVFDGAPDWATHAFKFYGSKWFWFGHNLPNPNVNNGKWETTNCGRYRTSKNQPETELDWTETLIRRQS
jgi:hypothetical protein